MRRGKEEKKNLIYFFCLLGLHGSKLLSVAVDGRDDTNNKNVTVYVTGNSQVTGMPFISQWKYPNPVSMGNEFFFVCLLTGFVVIVLVKYGLAAKSHGNFQPLFCHCCASPNP